jgi:hypothetical protein
MSKALSNIHEGNISATKLRQTVPGIINPLLWWCTPNLLSIDPNMLEAGLETYFTILLRAGIQRTYHVDGASCTSNVKIIGRCKIQMLNWNASLALFVTGFQLLVCLLSILGFVPWFLSENPIGPGVRLLKENIYFVNVVNKSALFRIFSELCNAPSPTLWQSLDIVVRIGESFSTKNEEVGNIILDKPKMVKAFANAKRYQ